MNRQLLLYVILGSASDMSAAAMQKAHSDGLLKVNLNARLLRAAEDGDVTLLTTLLEEGAQLTAVNESLQTPLHIAASRARTAAVKLFLKRGASHSPKDAKGCTPLHLAAQHGYTGCGQTLVDAGADRLIQNDDGYIPLHTAIDSGNATFCKMLIGAYAREQIELKDPSGASALHLAALCGNLNTFRTVYASALIKNPVTDSGMIPLHCSASVGAYALIPLMAKRTIESAQSLDGRTALHYAVSRSTDEFTKTVAELVKLKVPLNTYDRSERTETALHSAARKGSFAQVEILLTAGAQYTLINARNETALDLIITSLLVQNKRKPTSDKESDRARAYKYAQQLGYASICGILEDKEIIEPTTKRKRTDTCDDEEEVR